MATDFAETKSIAWKVTAAMLGLAINDVATGTPSASTVLAGDFSWRLMPAPQMLQNDFSITSNNTLQDLAPFSFAVAANEQWVAEFHLDVGDAIKTTGFQLSLAPPSGTVSVSLLVTPDVYGAGVLGYAYGAAASVPIDAAPGGFAGVNKAGIDFKVGVFNGASAGTMQLQVAQSVNSGTALVFRKGSYMRVSRL